MGIKNDICPFSISFRRSILIFYDFEIGFLIVLTDISSDKRAL